MNMIALFFLVSIAIGGVVWVFVYPILSGEKKAEARKESVTRAAPVVRAATAAARSQKSRREQVEGSLKELEQRRAKTPPLPVRISQAGLTWSKRQFLIISAAFGIAVFLLFFMIDAGILVALVGGFAAGFGAPLWLLKFLKARREAKFLA